MFLYYFCIQNLIIAMENKTNWASAAQNGLILSLVTIIFMLVSTFVKNGMLLNWIITIAKISSVITVLFYIMKRDSVSAGGRTYGGSFRYGMAVCLCSSVVCTFFLALLYLVIMPDTLDQMLQFLYGQLENAGIGGLIDYDTMRKALPAYLCIGGFLNCIICGLLFTAIIASFTKKNVLPFSETDGQND